MVEAIWLPVVGFEDAYEVSDDGEVRSVDRIAIYTRRDQYSGKVLTIKRHHRSVILRPGPSQSGHLSVVLGRGNTKAVHILVLEAFVGLCPDGCEARHWNDVPTDNRLSNLLWGTRSENILDAVRNGHIRIGEDHRCAKLKAADIPRIRAAAGRGCIARLAEELDVNEATIRQVRYGQTWKHV